MAACIFCKIAEGSISSRKVYEDGDTLVFHDLNPVAPTHLLVIPKKHISSLSASTDEDQGLLGHLQITLRKVAADNELKDFRVVTNNGRGAGQSVDHLHYHLLSGRRMIWPPG
ncbi:MAG: histidine triad nucleotide-binding protein [Elusimicrobiota bacterium]